MKEDQNQNTTISRRYFVPFIVVLILWMVTCLTGWAYLTMSKKKHLEELAGMADQINKDAIEMKKLEEKLKKLENIKTSDDFMVRDIELYIKARYRRVPSIVAKTIAENIVRVCKEEDVSPALVVGIVEIESQFNPMARNEKSKAIGLMQIMHEWVKKVGLSSVYDLYDIPTNIESGVKILKIHVKDDGKGDIAKGLYFYVGKDKSYAGKVFQAVGKFQVFRSTIYDDEKTVKEDPEKIENGKEEKKEDVVKPAETTN